AAMALLSALATAPTAQGGLIGADVTYQLLAPDTSTIFFSIPTQTITPATSLVDTSVDITTMFTDNEIIITNNLGGIFAPGFTGSRYLFSGTTITNVKIDNASSPESGSRGTLLAPTSGRADSFVGSNGLITRVSPETFPLEGGKDDADKEWPRRFE